MTLPEGPQRAVSLILRLDPELTGIVLLSLTVAMLARAIASVAGFPLGAFLGLDPISWEGSGHQHHEHLHRPAAGLWPDCFFISCVPERADRLSGPSLHVVGHGHRPGNPGISDCGLPHLSAIIAAFRTVMAEVGAILIVGGNIAGLTWVHDHGHRARNGQRQFRRALALGVVLLLLALAVNMLLHLIQKGTPGVYWTMDLNLSLSGVSKKYNGKTVLRDYSVTFTGGVSVLMSPNGCGKRDHARAARVGVFNASIFKNAV